MKISPRGFNAQACPNQPQLLRVTEFVTEDFDTKKATGAVLLDAAKASDRL